MRSLPIYSENSKQIKMSLISTFYRNNSVCREYLS